MHEDLISHMGEALTGRPPDTDLNMGGLLARLVDVAGTIRAAAAMLGRSPNTVSRWRRGVQKPKIGEQAVRAALRRASLPPGFEKQVKNGSRKMVITGWFHVSGEKSRRRSLHVGDHIPARKIANVVNAWLKGDDARANRLLWKSIDAHYTEGIDADEILGISFR